MDARRLKNPALWVCVGVLAFSAVALNGAIAALKLELKKLPINVDAKVQSIPTETASWKRVGQDLHESEAVLETLGTQNYLTRVYRKKLAAGQPENTALPTIELHMAYYTGMIDTVPHVPERCMVGGGWDIAQGTTVVPVPIDMSNFSLDPDATAEARAHGAGTDVKIYTGRTPTAPGKRVRLPRDVEHLTLRVTEFDQPGTDHKLFAGYFFIANGGLTSSAEGVRLLAFDLRSDYAFYLKVQFSSENAKSAQELGEQAASMLNELLPDIMLCVPDWTEVQEGNYPPDNPHRHKEAGPV